ncbi:dolichyl-phosphate-mannose--protein mannosyltransferase [Nitrospira sp.]|nr:dolichyl-phosphate-mannose--protein mannosyltransferase [Nitrospira sp.]
MKRPRHWFHLPVLILLCGLLFFSGLGNLGLTDRDEGSNAEAAREMVESGDWMSPTLNYEPRFAKPAFTYWIMSVIYLIFGVNELSARLHAALFGLLLIVLHYAFLAKIRGPGFAFIGSLMLGLNIEMVAISRVALTDSVLIFFTTLSLYAFWLGLYHEERSRSWIWVFYVGMAFATLTKGPVGLLIPVLAVATYLTMSRQWRDFGRRGHPLLGSIITIALALPWYAGMLWLHGERYTTSAQADTVGRFFSMIGGHGGTILFYVPILLFGFFPWSGFMAVRLWQTVKDWRASLRSQGINAIGGGACSDRSSALDLFAAAWLLSLFVFFSLSATRLPHYIGPLFPAASILAASFWYRATSDIRSPGVAAAFGIFTVAGYLLGLTLLSAPYLYATFVSVVEKEFPLAQDYSPGLGPILAGVLLVGGTALAHAFGRSDTKRPGAFWIAAASLTLALLMIIHITLPQFHQNFISPPQTLATIAGYNLGRDDRFITYGPHKPSWTFYARHKTIVIRPGEEEKLTSNLEHSGRTIVLLPTRLRSKLPIETEHMELLLERKGYTLLADRAMVKLPPKPAGPPPIPDHAFGR